MKDKIKARYEAIKNDPFQRGMLVGSVIGITATMTSAVALRANFDARGLYIPDEIIDAMRANGFAIGIKNGTRIVFALAPEVQ